MNDNGYAYIQIFITVIFWHARLLHGRYRSIARSVVYEYDYLLKHSPMVTLRFLHFQDLSFMRFLTLLYCFGHEM